MLPAEWGARRRMVAAVACVAVGAATAVAATVPDGGRETLVTAHAISPGHTLTAQDLRVVRVRADGLQTTDPSTAADLIGKTALIAIPAGAALWPSTFTADDPAPGSVILAVAIKSGAAPRLHIGDRVRVIRVASETDTSGIGAPTVLATSGLVVAVENAPDSDGSIVELRLPEGLATAVADAAARGSVALLRLAPTSGAGR